MKVVKNEVRSTDKKPAKKVVVSKKDSSEDTKTKKTQEDRELKLPLSQASNYIGVINTIMVDDIRANSLVTHFVNMLKNNNEGL